jgi:hypothetical protein
MKQSRRGWLSQVLEGVKNRRKSWQKIKNFLSTDPYIMEIMLEEEECIYYQIICYDGCINLG